MVGSKTQMIGWMPVLGRYDQWEFLLQAVNNGDNFMTAGDSQASARNKIILKIDHNQSLHLSFLSTFFKILPVAAD